MGRMGRMSHTARRRWCMARPRCTSTARELTVMALIRRPIVIHMRFREVTTARVLAFMVPAPDLAAITERTAEAAVNQVIMGDGKVLSKFSDCFQAALPTRSSVRRPYSERQSALNDETPIRATGLF